MGRFAEHFAGLALTAGGDERTREGSKVAARDPSESANADKSATARERVLGSPMKANELEKAPSSSPAGRRRLQRNGFGLLTLLLWIMGVASLAAVVLFVSDSDSRDRRNDELREELLFAANAGLAEFLDTLAIKAGRASYGYATSTAEVAAEKLLDLGDGRTVYRLISRATARPRRGETVTRTVSTVVIGREATGELREVPGTWSEER